MADFKKREKPRALFERDLTPACVIPAGTPTIELLNFVSPWEIDYVGGTILIDS
jgi:hypothetical protein